MPDPDIQNLINTLLLKGNRKAPLAELGIHPTIKEKLLGRPLKTLKDDVDFWHQAGYDYIKLQPGVDFNPDGVGLSGKVTFSEDGTLSRKWASEGKGVISTMEEFEKYRFPKTKDFDYSNFEKVHDLLPEGMGVIGQYGDIFTMTWEMMGFEEFSLAMYMNPDLVKTLNDKLGSLVLNMFEYFAQSDAVDILWYSDDIAYSNGLMIAPEQLDIYFFHWLKKIGELAKKYNKPFIYHTDGILYDVMERILDCGVHALHPIEPKAMAVKEVKQRYGEHLCLMGHVDVDLLSRGTPEQVKQKVRQNIEEAGYNGGYCVGSGNSLPEYVNFENYMAMLEANKGL